ncbi:hypothetical protein [Lysobacter fragariae]
MPTNINIQNSTDTSLSLSTGVLPQLSDSYWGINSATAGGDSKTQVLWMDRNVGITDGDVWVFTTSFEFAGTVIQLQESLTGTRSSSDIEIRIVAGAQNSGWTAENTSLQFTGSDGNNYQLNGTFFLNGTYDDVTYSLIPV